MTTAIKINANDGKTRNVMTGGETTVDFDFPIFDATHIRLIETDTNGNITELVKDTDFTVPAGSVNQQAGGTLNLDATQYPSGATSGHVFTALQDAPNSRTTDFNQAGDFFADTLNKELDLITQQMQQFTRDLARAPLSPEDTALTSVALPDPSDGFGLIWDGVAGALRNTTTSLVNLEGDAETVADNIDSVNTVAGNAVDINTLAPIATDITTVASIASDVTDAANNTPLSNRTAITDPTVNDDAEDGYSRGSLWVNTLTNKIFLCANPGTGAAVWQAFAGSFALAEVYGFTKDSNGDLIVTTTNQGQDNITQSDYVTFDDVLFSASGFTFSISNGDLIATI